ncbi:MAG: carbohydrate binding domain-containing protein, partial [Clostridia bacterium]|nr:carbohydrate binding domain-containing protein [Clostridia bacterium]
MKRILAFTLILIMLFPLSALALNEEIFTVNRGFENGTTQGFVSYAGTSDFTVSSQYKHTGSYGLLMSNRSGRYATCARDVTDDLNRLGKGVYSISLWIRLKDEDQIKPTCYIAIKLLPNGHDQEYYLTGPSVTLSTSWQKLTFSGVIGFNEDIGLKQALIYPQGFIGDEAPDVMLDDFSFKKTASYEDTSTDISGVPRTEKTTVGAIRWDAWYTHDGKNQSVISQVERSLSPKEFHFRAPFFAEVTKDDKIIVPAFTQEVFDREMEYAIKAGIDYFAYVWYNTDMKAARTFHTRSKYRDQVKMCTCFDGNAIGKSFARTEMRTLLKQDYYMTVLDGRPLMYYLCSSSNSSLVLEDIKYYRELCKELGIKEPFAVIMGMNDVTA